MADAGKRLCLYGQLYRRADALMADAALWLLVSLLAGWLLSPADGYAADPSALWKIVNGQCVPHEQEAHDPAPCAAIDLTQGVEKGYAVLKDLRGIAQFLLIPTVRIGGIEDPAILAPDETNYWDAAWRARSFLEGRLHTTLPRDMVSLAINSQVGRTQDQFHIHIDCVRPDVREAITGNLDMVTDAWTAFPLMLAGHRYRSLRIHQPTLDGADPFRLLADRGPQALAEMGLHTLVVIGAVFPDGIEGFVLLDNHADLAAGDRASGEELQDHSCLVATK